MKVTSPSKAKAAAVSAKPKSKSSTTTEILDPGVRSRYNVPNLERALGLMELLIERPEGTRLTDLARDLNIPKNSVFRIAKTLASYGYLEYDEKSKHYSLGYRLLSLGLALLDEEGMLEKSHDILRDLRNGTNETALLGRILGNRGIVLEQALSQEPVKFHINIGHRFQLHTGAPGKAMVSFLPDAERSTFLASLEYPVFNERTISSPAKFEEACEAIRKNGYATDDEEEVEGLRCVAAPVLNHKNYPIAAVWITAPTHRLPKANFPKVAKIVMLHAARLSARFGHRQTNP